MVARLTKRRIEATTYPTAVAWLTSSMVVKPRSTFFKPSYLMLLKPLRRANSSISEIDLF